MTAFLSVVLSFWIVIPIWALLAVSICLFVHGAKHSNDGHGGIKEQLRNIQWPVGNGNP